MRDRAFAVRESASLLVRRIEHATPADRDRAVDALRAFAILGVVLGHWLVTALVFDSGTVRVASPLLFRPRLAPISWVFQTLAVFFLVGGRVATKSHASARARGATYGQWLRGRLARLFRPVAAVLAVWLLAAAALLAAGVGVDTLHTLVKLVLSPLWFLLVLAALTVATPIVCRMHALWPLAAVLYVDLYRFGFGGPEWTGWINVGAGWLVPYCLGALWARRGDGTSLRAAGWALLLGGAGATALLVLFAGYPASMVGVPGARMSNLNPPTAAAVTFGLAQCGAALLLLGPLRRTLRRPVLWAVVALVNLSALTIFLWHQTSMIAVSCLGSLVGVLPGVHTVPDDGTWVAARLGWLPVFAVMLAMCWTAFRTYEQPGRGATHVVNESGPARGKELRSA
ncbi:acyltransferase [Streptomyces sp. NPDC006632]|uniref:acyltransferase family protein n=1 Tax=Streptomyces sp. NPDC006632 TaxID=3157182 RepID=UPI0033B7C004